MTKDEALKLALEALAVKFSEGWHEGIKIDASDIMLLNDAAQALAEQEPVGPEPFGFFQYDIRLDAWVQNRINNKGVAFYTKEKK